MRYWIDKFRCAIRGMVVGFVGQSSHYVHLALAVAVLVAAAWLRLDAVRWAVLLLTITFVFTVEYVNSSIETLAKAVDRRRNPLLRDALDIASGAVLCACLGAVAVGVLVLGPPLWRTLFP